MQSLSLPSQRSLFGDEPLTPHTHRTKAKPARLVAAPSQTAQEAIGLIESGFRIVGITKGQFGLIDVLEALVNQTGPADVVFCTWVMAEDVCKRLLEWGAAAKVTRVRLLCDQAFCKIKSEQAVNIERWLGPENTRCCRTHAKLVLIGNETWKIAVRSSMNANLNMKAEQFDIDDAPDIYGFFLAYIDELWAKLPPGFQYDAKTMNKVFKHSELGQPGSGKALDGKVDPKALVGATEEERLSAMLAWM